MSMRTKFISVLVVLAAISVPGVIAQDADCGCAGEWVQSSAYGPSLIDRPPQHIETFATVACESINVPAHGHSVFVNDHCSQGGGQCSTLGWHSNLQTIYSSDSFPTLNLPAYTVQPGYEAREIRQKTDSQQGQSFQCQVNGVPNKTLSRIRVITTNIDIDIQMNKLRDCPEQDPPGDPGS